MEYLITMSQEKRIIQPDYTLVIASALPDKADEQKPAYEGPPPSYDPLARKIKELARDDPFILRHLELGL